MDVALLNTDLKATWGVIDVNATIDKSAAGILRDVEKILLNLGSNMQLGFDVEDDCTPFTVGSEKCCELFATSCMSPLSAEMSTCFASTALLNSSHWLQLWQNHLIGIYENFAFITLCL